MSAKQQARETKAEKLARIHRREWLSLYQHACRAFTKSVQRADAKLRRSVRDG